MNFAKASGREHRREKSIDDVKQRGGEKISSYFWILHGLSLHRDFSASNGPISKIKKVSGSIDTWPTSKHYISQKYDVKGH